MIVGVLLLRSAEGDTVKVLRPSVVAAILLLVALIVWDVPETNRIRTPIILVLLGIPLIFKLVPRNWLYGVRTPRTMWQKPESWYIQNQIGGVFLVGIGLIWLVVVTL